MAYFRFLIFLILTSWSASSLAQSKFLAKFDQFEFSITGGQLGLSSIEWNDGAAGSSVLKHLTTSNDKYGILNDEFHTKRPFNTKMRYYSYGDDRGGSSIESRSNLKIGINARIKSIPKLFVGLQLVYESNPFGWGSYEYETDLPYGQNTLYFKEVGNFDEVNIRNGYGTNDWDTTVYVARTKLAYFDHPRNRAGLGFSAKYLVLKNKTDRNQLSIVINANLTTSLGNRTRIFFIYYDYDGSGRYGDGQIGGVPVYENYSVSVYNRSSNRRSEISFKTPAINGFESGIAMEYHRQLFKNFPLTLSLSAGLSNNSYWSNWKPVASTEGMFYNIGLGYKFE